MKVTDIYKALEFYRLDDDTKQDIAIKIWQARDSYDPEKAKLTTWVGAIVKNHQISLSRKDKPEIPMTNFDLQDSDGAMNAVTDKLESDDLTPEAGMIASEEIKELLDRLKMLPGIYQKIMLATVSGYSYEDIASTYDLPVGTVRTRVMRAREILAADKKGKAYLLVDLTGPTEYPVNSFKEASEIVGCHSETVRLSYIGKKRFKKKWRISGK